MAKPFQSVDLTQKIPIFSLMKTLIILFYAIAVFIGNLQAQTTVEKPLDPCKLDSIQKELSPNGDGKNDFLQLNTPCVFEQFSFKLFNRWGSDLYSTTDQRFKWNGMDIKGNRPEPGTYFYKIDYWINGERKEKTGFLNIF